MLSTHIPCWKSPSLYYFETQDFGLGNPRVLSVAGLFLQSLWSGGLSFLSHTDPICSLSFPIQSCFSALSFVHKSEFWSLQVCVHTIASSLETTKQIKNPPEQMQNSRWNITGWANRLLCVFVRVPAPMCYRDESLKFPSLLSSGLENRRVSSEDYPPSEPADPMWDGHPISK